jgi:F-type H+-transporting ATPase subunit b
MFTLLSFTPFQPSPGLAIWSLLIFLLFWFIMGKYAFKPIAKALEKREHDIQHALDQAKLAKEEMKNMESQNEELLSKAKEEKNRILQEAKEMKNQILSEAKAKAKEEANKIITSAQTEIENQKKSAMADVTNQVGGMAIGIAEQLLRKNLSNDQEQTAFVQDLVKDFKLN